MKKTSKKQKIRNNRRAKTSAKQKLGGRKLKKRERQIETQLYQDLAAEHGSRRDRGWNHTPGDDPAAARRADRRETEREIRSISRRIQLKKS